ncbi:MAG: trypsin-like peptidase domain-containing protein [Gammaproteobacteria bacterium]
MRIAPEVLRKISHHARHNLTYMIMASVLVGMIMPRLAAALTLPPEQVALIKETIFEVVIPKPDETTISYDQPINFDLMPYSYRKDKYVSIGTAFALPNGLVATAAHVLNLHSPTLFGVPMLRDTKGTVYEIDKIVKYSTQRDFAVFTLKDYKPIKSLTPTQTPHINEPVFAVGNALGDGIVIRDGTYTSDTPEDREGEWKWIRFSAAASPGNSGGPLLDKNGNVLGIVIAKSPNENLNFALPLKEVFNAPDNLAVMKRLQTYQLPNMDFSDTNTFEIKVDLPLPPKDLQQKLQPSNAQFSSTQLAAIFTRYGGDIFPRGKNARKLLSSTLTVKEPTLIARRPDGDWEPRQATQLFKNDLGENGFVIGGKISPAYYLVRLRKPDSVTLQDLMDDSKLFMDLYLKAFPIKRDMGYETRRVTSLGQAQQSRWFRDNYGRAWQAQRWDIPFLNRQLLAYSSPTPEGSVILLSVPPVEATPDFEKDTEALVNFMYFTYGGSISDWSSFMKLPKLMPTPLDTLKINYDGKESLSVHTNQFTFECTADCMSISPKSRLDVGFNFANNDNKPSLNIGAVALFESIGADKTLVVSRVLQPAEDLGEEFRKRWLDVSNSTTPYDGRPIIDNGRTSIHKNIGCHRYKDKAKADEESCYVAGYIQSGDQNKESFERKFGALTQRIVVLP